MSDQVTQDSLRIGTSDLFACFKCGIPKNKSEFEGESITCKVCSLRIMNNRDVEIAETDLNKTKFEIAREQLLESQEPAVPGGVQRAHKILGNKTSTELLAEVARDMSKGTDPDGNPSWVGRDPKLFIRTLELLQRSEFKHDDFLSSRPPANDLSYEEIRSLSIDTIITEMIRDRDLRLKVFEILYDQCPSMVDEIMQVANVRVLEPALESGGAK